MEQDIQQGETVYRADSGTRLHDVCGQFKEALSAGRKPRIEDYLARVDPQDQSAVLRQLVQDELDQCRARGEEPSPDDYRHRFPQYAEFFDSTLGTAVAKKRIGEYELLEFVGRGGMGVVYKARHAMLQKRVVALKIVASQHAADTQVAERFKREMELISALDHENIVRAYDAGIDDGSQYLVMEFINGQDLEDVVRRQGPLSIGAACEVVRQAALGLQHAHENGLVHRDIKPSNLMLTTGGRIKVLDLGLAKFHADNQLAGKLTQTGYVMGTVDFMAPEQWEDSSQVDIRADLYSLGCVMFYLLTGRPPYDDEHSSMHRKLLAHTKAPIPSFRDYYEMRDDDSVDTLDDVQRLLECLMAKQRDDRLDEPAEVAGAAELFADADQLLQLVPDANSTQPSSKGPTTPGGKDSSKKTRKDTGRAGKWRSNSQHRSRIRKIRVTAAVALAVGAVIVMASFGVWRLVVSNSRTIVDPEPRPGPTESPGDVQPPQVVADFGSLPGLNGRSWIEETPWLSPGVRHEIIMAQTQPATSAAELPALNTSDVEETYRTLKDWTRNHALGGLSASSPLSTQQQKYVQETLDPSLSAEALLSRYKSTVRQLSFESAKLRATDKHLLAILQNNLDKNDDAEQSFNEAIQQYRQDGAQVVSLLALCLSDDGSLYSEQGRFQDAADRYVESRAVLGDRISNFFLVDSYCNEAGAYRKLADRNRASACLVMAEEIAAKLPENHPLRAHVHERSGWFYMDRWEVDKARKEFEAAKEIRSYNATDRNPAAKAFVLHNWHGLALAYRYAGEIKKSIEAYDILLLDEIDDALKGVEITSDQYKPLELRKYESTERRADCELYGTHDTTLAALKYTEALATLRKLSADLSLPASENAEREVRLMFKLALCNFAAEQPNEVEARTWLTEARELFKTLPEGKQKQFELFGQVTDILDSAVDQPQRLAGLATVVRQACDAGSEQIDREELDLLLLTIRMFPAADQINLYDRFVHELFPNSPPVEVAKYMQLAIRRGS